MQIRKNGSKDEYKAEVALLQRPSINTSNASAYHHKITLQKSKHPALSTIPNPVHSTYCLLPIDSHCLKANPEHHKRHSNTIVDPSMSTRLYTEEPSSLSRGKEFETINFNQGMTMDKDVFNRDNYSTISRRRIAVLKKSQSDTIYKFITPFSSNNYKIAPPRLDAPLELIKEKYTAFIGKLKSRENGMVDIIVKLQNRLREVQKCLAKYESIK